MTNLVTDIRDIKGFVPVPFDWRWLWVLVPLIVIAAAVAFWLWKRNRPKRAAAIMTPPSPYAVAVRALQRLRNDQPPVEQFYTRLSDIVRQYLESRFLLRAPERTTEEFLYEVAQSGALTTAHKELLGVFLQECDLVKFAKHQPIDADRQRAFAAAERFVEETRAQ